MKFLEKASDDQRKEIAALRDANGQLRREVNGLRNENHELKNELAEIRKAVHRLQSEAEVAVMKPKTSTHSSSDTSCQHHAGPGQILWKLKAGTHSAKAEVAVMKLETLTHSNTSCQHHAEIAGKHPLCKMNPELKQPKITSQYVKHITSVQNQQNKTQNYLQGCIQLSR